MSTSSGNSSSNGVFYSYDSNVHDAENAELKWQLKRPLEKGATVVCSPPFKLGNTSWRFDVYPKAQAQEDRDFFSAYLTCLSRSQHDVFLCFTAISTDGDRMCMGGTASFSREAFSWGFSRFLHHKIIRDHRTQYYADETLRLIATVKIQDPWPGIMKQFTNGCTVQETPEETATSAEIPNCVVCLVNPQTSGFLHDGESHKCVCEDCARELAKNEKLFCPICMEPVDKVIYKYY